jgi:hypothetical protein
MSARLIQRGTVVALVLVSIAAAVAAHVVTTRGLHSKRSERRS